MMFGPVPRRRLEQGLTLLELAVVVAIIGVLTALLLPALRSARERARTTACARNLSTLCGAVGVYRNDFGEHYPTGRIRNARDDPERRYWWGGYRRVGNMPWPVERELGVIYGYLAGLDDVLTCPSAHHLPFQYWLKSHSSHYGYNGCWLPMNLGRDGLSAVSKPAQTVMFADCAGLGDGRVTVTQFVYTRDGFHFRHSDRANVLWCDGHVSTETGFLRHPTLGLGGLPPPARFYPD